MFYVFGWLIRTGLKESFVWETLCCTVCAVLYVWFTNSNLFWRVICSGIIWSALFVLYMFDLLMKIDTKESFVRELFSLRYVWCTECVWFTNKYWFKGFVCLGIIWFALFTLYLFDSLTKLVWKSHFWEILGSELAVLYAFDPIIRTSLRVFCSFALCVWFTNKIGLKE